MRSHYTHTVAVTPRDERPLQSVPWLRHAPPHGPSGRAHAQATYQRATARDSRLTEVCLGGRLGPERGTRNAWLGATQPARNVVMAGEGGSETEWYREPGQAVTGSGDRDDREPGQPVTGNAGRFCREAGREFRRKSKPRLANSDHNF